MHRILLLFFSSYAVCVKEVRQEVSCSKLDISDSSMALSQDFGTPSKVESQISFNPAMQLDNKPTLAVEDQEFTKQSIPESVTTLNMNKNQDFSAQLQEFKARCLIYDAAAPSEVETDLVETKKPFDPMLKLGRVYAWAKEVQSEQKPFKIGEKVKVLPTVTERELLLKMQEETEQEHKLEQDLNMLAVKRQSLAKRRLRVIEHLKMKHNKKSALETNMSLGRIELEKASELSYSNSKEQEHKKYRADQTKHLIKKYQEQLEFLEIEIEELMKILQSFTDKISNYESEEGKIRAQLHSTQVQKEMVYYDLMEMKRSRDNEKVHHFSLVTSKFLRR